MLASIRGFRAEDSERVVTLYKNSNEWFENVEVTREFIMQASMRPDFRFHVAEAEGEVIGFIGALFYESVGRAEVGPVCVDEKFREQGIGKMLVEKSLDLLKDNRIFRVTARVKAGNDNANAFFSSLGFEEEAVLRNYTKEGEDVTQYVRFI